MDQNQPQNPSVVKVMPSAPKKGISKLAIAIIIIIVLLVLAYIFYHFNIAGVRVFVKGIIAPLPATTFSGVTNTPQLVKTVTTQVTAASSLNISYTGSVSLSLSAGAAPLLSIPLSIDAAKAGSYYRVSFAANLSSALLFISSLINLSNSSKINKVNPIINGLSIYNTTGYIECSTFNSSSNCTYSKSPSASLFLPVNSTSLLPSVTNLSALNSSNGISIKYTGVQNYSGNECSILSLSGNSANMSVSGKVCMSNTLGLPLFANVQLASTASSGPTSGFSISFVLSSTMGSTPTISGVTSLPKNAVFS